VRLAENDAFNVHSVSISNMSTATVKRVGMKWGDCESAPHAVESRRSVVGLTPPSSAPPIVAAFVHKVEAYHCA
jgi:hypothetical protein